MINVLQIGFGPLGIQITKYIEEKSAIRTIAVVDTNPEMHQKTLRDIDSVLSDDVFVYSSVKDAIDQLQVKPDVAIITTVSSLEKLIPQVKDVADYNIPVISTCEELSYPWKLQPQLSKELDAICKENNIACLGTGINPGFLMDYLPSVMSSVCKDIDEVIVERIQNATPRRIPFQKKIGAGLNLEAFETKRKEGSLRHVGLPESVYLLAQSLEIQLDNVVEEIQPVISEENIETGDISINEGDARGVEQIAYGYQGDKCKIRMHFKAAINEPKAYDRVTIKGTPSFSSEIDGGVNGDIATCAITINSIKSVLKAPAGLHTMLDIAVPGYLN
ncbi:hypothetical protein GTQ40_17285 [Flavobacteriaceae bacterium R38]|nr:hypothetical protein [Flavobacteriaceae bacterium R38]